MYKLIRYHLFLAVLLVLTSCGGSSSTTAPSVVFSAIPRVTINWPDVTREFGAPKTALSAEILITPSSQNADPVLWTVDRPQPATKSVVTYTGPSVKYQGPISLKVSFKGQRGGRGATIAEALISASISEAGNLVLSDGGEIGVINSGGEFTILNIDNFFSAKFEIGKSVTLVLTGYNTATRQIIALDQEFVGKRAVVTALPGSSKISIDGLKVTPSELGSIKLRVQLDQYSVDGQFSVELPVVSTKLISNVVAEMTYVRSNSTLWVATGRSTLDYKIAKVDPVNGTWTEEKAIGFAPLGIDASSDGSQIYVYGASILQRYTVASKKMSDVISLPPGIDPRLSDIEYRIKVNPFDPLEVAYCRSPLYNAYDYQIFIIRVNVVFPAAPADTNTKRLLDLNYLNSNTLIASSQATSVSYGNPGTIKKITINSDGSTSDVATVNSNDLLNIGRSTIANNKIYAAGGNVLNTDTFTLEAQFSDADQFGTRTIFAVTSDASNNLIWVLTYDIYGRNPRLNAYNSSTFALVASAKIELPDTSKTFHIERVGSKGMVFLTEYRDLYYTDKVPGL